MMAGQGKNKQSLPILAFHLRALVLVLGESATPVWWKTEFMNETGLSFWNVYIRGRTFMPQSMLRGKLHPKFMIELLDVSACTIYSGFLKPWKQKSFGCPRIPIENSLSYCVISLVTRKN
jgi:hypothetical protein